VIPVYFNEGNLFPLYKELKKTILSRPEFLYELIFVDDGSKDNSFEKLVELRKIDNKIKILKLSRNFGSHVAILAGLSNCTGDCATVISADLQDSPNIIVEMYKRWNDGHKVVLAVRADREDSWLRTQISNLYYRLMKKVALPNMPKGGFDCFLIDRAVINIIKNIEEKNSTLMGQILWCGFKSDIIYYVRKKRDLGVSRWTFSKKIKLFVDSFTAFSYLPVRLMSLLGISISFVSFLFGIFVVINKIVNGGDEIGWSSLMVAIAFLSGIQMTMLGIIGEYLWRNFDESKKRPIFIIDEKIGFDK
jgi:dolichol-phosphate mannosyltransferase